MWKVKLEADWQEDLCDFDPPTPPPAALRSRDLRGEKAGPEISLEMSLRFDPRL